MKKLITVIYVLLSSYSYGQVHLQTRVEKETECQTIYYRYSDINNAMRSAPEPNYNHHTNYILDYTVARGKLKDKRLVDSLYNTVRFYLNDARKQGCNRIRVDVHTASPFSSWKQKIFTLNELLAAYPLNNYTVN